MNDRTMDRIGRAVLNAEREPIASPENPSSYAVSLTSGIVVKVTTNNADGNGYWNGSLYEYKDTSRTMELLSSSIKVRALNGDPLALDRFYIPVETASQADGTPVFHVQSGSVDIGVYGASSRAATGIAAFDFGIMQSYPESRHYANRLSAGKSSVGTWDQVPNMGEEIVLGGTIPGYMQYLVNGLSGGTLHRIFFSWQGGEDGIGVPVNTNQVIEIRRTDTLAIITSVSIDLSVIPFRYRWPDDPIAVGNSLNYGFEEFGTFLLPAGQSSVYVRAIHPSDAVMSQMPVVMISPQEMLNGDESFHVVESPNGVATIYFKLASALNSGLMSDDEQNFNGFKYFQSGVWINRGNGVAYDAGYDDKIFAIGLNGKRRFVYSVDGVTGYQNVDPSCALYVGTRHGVVSNQQVRIQSTGVTGIPALLVRGKGAGVLDDWGSGIAAIFVGSVNVDTSGGGGLSVGGSAVLKDGDVIDGGTW